MVDIKRSKLHFELSVTKMQLFTLEDFPLHKCTEEMGHFLPAGSKLHDLKLCTQMEYQLDICQCARLAN